ncbi:MAG: carbohydrate ABC transporter permease [Spirochaetaceae bacterium]
METLSLQSNNTSNKFSTKNISGVVINSFMWIFATIVFAPFVLFILNTFKEKEHIYDVFHIPDLRYLDNYKAVFETSDFFQSLFLTVLISSITLIIIVNISALAGYAISRSKYKIIKYLYVILVAGQIVPAQTSMIPIYKIGVATHLINTVPFLIILYVAGGSAFATILIAGFTKTIPLALEEAANIDGCGRFKTFYKIVFPLLMPAIATIVATTIYWYWNDFQGPLIYLNNGKVGTLMMTIYNFMGSNNTTDWGPVYALCLLASIPMVVFYIFTQRILLKGLVVGSVKG